MIRIGFVWLLLFVAGFTHDQTCLVSAQQPTRAPMKFGEMMSTDDAIAFFTRRLEGRPGDVSDRVTLARLYLRRAGQEDDFPSYTKAEELLRQAANANPGHLPAKIFLAKALMARHQFGEALVLANGALAKAPKNALALSIRGDAQLELGRYDDAAATYAEMLVQERSAPTIAREAHLFEMIGRNDEAIDRMQEALNAAEQADLDSKEIAWYEMRLASMEQNRGRLEQAASGFRKALDHRPDYAPAMSGLAEVLGLQGHLQSAQTLYQDGIRIHGEPPMMVGLGDVYAKQGDAERAELWYDKAEQAMAQEALTAAAAHYREVARFYCDKNRHLKTALDLAQQDLKLRQDVFAYDLLAWAQFKNGMHAEAAKSMERAMEVGTRHAPLYFHAGMIFESLGKTEASKQMFQQALELNPTFSLLEAEVARRKI